MAIIDLSHFLEAGMPLFPGTAPPVFEETASIKTNGYREKKIALCPHTDTRMDLPARSFLFDGFQLKISEADGSPVCAVAIGR
jgi:kynurenine formamidase